MRPAVTTAIWLGLALAPPTNAETLFVVAPATVADEKAVFATVESRRVVPARARIGGTVAELAVKEGDHVELGQVVATVGDEKLALQMKSLDAQIAGLEAQLAQAQTDLTRAEDLFGSAARSREHASTKRAPPSMSRTMRCARASPNARSSSSSSTEGSVLAPAAGRVLKVPLTTGTVVMAGESVADIAEQNFVLRLRVPERHARFLKAGDTIRVDAAELGESAPRFGTIRLVYPQIEDGRVVADAEVEGLGDYFVERAHPRLGLGGRTHRLHRSGRLRHDALRHRLRQGPQGRRHRCGRAGPARARLPAGPISRTASKSCPASTPAIAW